MFSLSKTHFCRLCFPDKFPYQFTVPAWWRRAEWTFFPQTFNTVHGKSIEFMFRCWENKYFFNRLILFDFVVVGILSHFRFLGHRKLSLQVWGSCFIWKGVKTPFSMARMTVRGRVILIKSWKWKQYGCIDCTCYQALLSSHCDSILRTRWRSTSEMLRPSWYFTTCYYI